MIPIPHLRNRLFCPGPTPVPQRTALAGLETNVYHRSAEFKEVLIRCRQGLRPFFGSKDDPIIFTSSGTGALEAALVNLTDEGDEVLVVNGGKFGERWTKLAARYRCKVHEIAIDWGESPDPEQLVARLQDEPKIRAVFLQANETSTGVAYPVESIAKAIRAINQDVLIIVDGVSALVAHEMDMQSWDIDCVVSGSQKGFGIPPGLSFLALSERAKSSLSQRPRFYFDFEKEFQGQQKGESAWTPATTLLFSLEQSLQELNHFGAKNMVSYHARMAEACRQAVQALGLKLFSRRHHSQALTAICLPTDIDGVALVKHAKSKYGAYFAGGQDQAKGKIIRIAHLGIFDQFDLLTAVSAFEFCLRDFGYKFDLGSGVAAAMLAISNSDPDSR